MIENSDMLRASGLRKDTRSLLDSEVTLSWEDAQGVSRLNQGVCVDVSERGMGILVEDEIPLRTYVNFHVKRLSFAGSGSVRSARRKGLRFQVGLEFSGTLHLPTTPAARRTRKA